MVRVGWMVMAMVLVGCGTYTGPKADCARVTGSYLCRGATARPAGSLGMDRPHAPRAPMAHR